MRIRIDAVDLPGRTCPAPAGGPAYTNVHVAVQRRSRPGELLQPQPGDAGAVSWTLECTAVVTPDGVDVQGPYVQDRLGRRFVFLSWGTVDGSGGFTMFRRAKLMLDVVPEDTLAAAARAGLLVGRLGLTGDDGFPLCGRVLPPYITWTAGPAGQK
ncbi:DUF5990 family protein [Streptomyces sp. NPDC051207]|uniref:DUF5990 family protein n=1 Tax=Streptomyces sp. NPDC051207 TaxID=3154641 RepID=UPI0034185CB0